MIKYTANPTCRQFHDSDAFVRGLMGPIGSGKSVACCVELFRRIAQQKPHNGKRKSRWAVIRNSYRELHDTTMQTWWDWFPKDLGEFRSSDMSQTLRFNDVEALILFRALDRPDDISKLLSLELTGAWINEAREVPKPVLDMLQGRVDRFPSRRDGGPSWTGIIMDTNPPDSDHWWYRIFEEEKPETWEIFKQPSGLSEEAENLPNLGPEYYTRLQHGHDSEWINVYCHGQYGFVRDGKPVYPEYKDNIHAAEHDLTYDHSLPLWIGLDFGLTPAASFAQQQRDGQWWILDELVTQDMGAERFAELLHKKIRSEYRGANTEIWGDPAGDSRAQTDENTPYLILSANGIEASPVHTNDPIIRREALARHMTRLSMNGYPAIQISPKARTIRKGLAGGYKYRRLQVVGEERFVDKPDKNMYSHVVESLEYLMIGAGEGMEVIAPDEFSHRPRVIRAIRAN